MFGRFQNTNGVALVEETGEPPQLEFISGPK